MTRWSAPFATAIFFIFSSDSPVLTATCCFFLRGAPDKIGHGSFPQKTPQHNPPSTLVRPSERKQLHHNRHRLSMRLQYDPTQLTTKSVHDIQIVPDMFETLARRHSSLYSRLPPLYHSSEQQPTSQTAP